MLPLPWCRVTEGKVGPDKVSSEEFFKKICSTKHLKLTPETTLGWGHTIALTVVHC